MNRKTDKEKTKIYAVNLKTLRRSKNITQEELGGKINRTQKQVAKYEQGTAMLSLEMAQKVAKELNVSIDVIAGHTFDKQEKTPINLFVKLKEINELNPEHLYLLEGQIEAFLISAKKIT